MRIQFGQAVTVDVERAAVPQGILEDRGAEGGVGGQGPGLETKDDPGASPVPNEVSRKRGRGYHTFSSPYDELVTPGDSGSGQPQQRARDNQAQYAQATADSSGSLLARARGHSYRFSPSRRAASATHHSSQASLRKPIFSLPVTTPRACMALVLERSP